MVAASASLSDPWRLFFAQQPFRLGAAEVLTDEFVCCDALDRLLGEMAFGRAHLIEFFLSLDVAPHEAMPEVA